MSINRDYAEFLASFNSAKFQSLRDAQAHVLREYSTNHTSSDSTSFSDVAIELPTGAGKTLIALLIAEAWRQGGKKVAILSANKTLARQMLAEGNALGIPVVLMEGRGEQIPGLDKRAYQRATKVAIMNYWVYFNQNPVIDPADLLIMDDAHLAEHCLHSLYSAEIDGHTHQALFSTLVTELQARFPEYSILADAMAGHGSLAGAPELLSFIDQVDAADRIREIIDSSAALQTDTDLRFRWRRIRDSLLESNIYLSLNSIWIRPYIYPLISNSHYSEAQQRLYLSATVGDSGDLSRRLGVRSITKIPVPPEYAEKTSGRRLIVMNRIEDSDIPRRLDKVILTALQIHPKSVWLCSSEADAKKYRDAVLNWLNRKGFVAHPSWILSPLGDEIDQFKSSPAGHLFVAGRFDGMDFKAGECRLVVLTTLPRAINIQEEFISSYLRDSGFMLKRLNQRVVQALGRCNRADDDFGVYVLADRRFANHFGLESNKEGLPLNIVAEMDMAQDLAEISEEALLNKVESFLRGDFRDYNQDIQAYLSGVPRRPSTRNLPDTSGDEVLGWTRLFSNKNYGISADRFEACWNAARGADLLEIGAFYGWQWAKALYLQSLLGEPGARDRALTVFESAIGRGGQSSWFNRMRASLNRARRTPVFSEDITREDYATHLIRIFDDLLERLGTTGNRFERWCDSITQALQSDSHSQYQEGLEKLGAALGYNAMRPRYDTATDCRWRGVFGNHREVISFEAKIEHREGNEITATHIGQAHNQLARAKAEYEDHGYIVRGTLATHLTSLRPEAEASAGPIKVLTKPAIMALWNRVKLALSLYRDSWSLHDIPARSAAAAALRPRIPRTGWLVRAIDTDTRFVTEELLLAEWSQP
jgi:hypothetical protein